jgi:hypothetical protein
VFQHQDGLAGVGLDHLLVGGVDVLAEAKVDEEPDEGIEVAVAVCSDHEHDVPLGSWAAPERAGALEPGERRLVASVAQEGAQPRAAPR